MSCLVQPLDGKSSPDLCLQKDLVCKRGGRSARSSPDARTPVSAFGIPQTRFVQLQKGLYSSV